VAVATEMARRLQPSNRYRYSMPGMKDGGLVPSILASRMYLPVMSVLDMLQNGRDLPARADRRLVNGADGTCRYQLASSLSLARTSSSLTKCQKHLTIWGYHLKDNLTILG